MVTRFTKGKRRAVGHLVYISDDHTPYSEHRGINLQEARANAVLDAHAPELFHALEDAINLIDWKEFPNEVNKYMNILKCATDLADGI